MGLGKGRKEWVVTGRKADDREKGKLKKRQENKGISVRGFRKRKEENGL